MLRKVGNVAAGLALALATSSLWAATLTLPEELIPLQVDDNPVSSSFFRKVSSLELRPGSHMLKLKYEDLYETGYDDHQVVESDPFWLQIEIGQAPSYKLVFDRAATAEGARNFANSPEVRLVAKGGKIAGTTKVTREKNAVPAANTAPVVKPVDPQAPHPDAAAMLDYWWQQATPAQRAVFREKIKQQ